MAVALRLGLNLRAPHTCRCGVLIDAHGQHGLVCKQAASRIARHQQFNDMVARALVLAGVPVTKEPVGISRRDGKRPDEMTQYHGGKAADLGLMAAVHLQNANAISFTR